jgi:hypothetical protein
LIFLKRLIENLNGERDSQSDSDAISTLSSVYISLGSKLGLKSTRRCGICVERINGVQFENLKSYIEKFLDTIKDTVFDLSYSIPVDNNRDYFWIIIDASRIEDNVACIIAVGEIMEQNSFPQQYVSAVFEFSKDGTESQPYYLIYNYKLDKFYPFVPIVNRRNTRNKLEEIKIMKAVKDEKLPFEEDMEDWRPIWYLPF